MLERLYPLTRGKARETFFVSISEMVRKYHRVGGGVPASLRKSVGGRMRRGGGWGRGKGVPGGWIHTPQDNISKDILGTFFLRGRDLCYDNTNPNLDIPNGRAVYVSLTFGEVHFDLCAAVFFLLANVIRKPSTRQSARTVHFRAGLNLTVDG